MVATMQAHVKRHSLLYSRIQLLAGLVAIAAILLSWGRVGILEYLGMVSFVVFNAIYYLLSGKVRYLIFGLLCLTAVGLMVLVAVSR